MPATIDQVYDLTKLIAIALDVDISTPPTQPPATGTGMVFPPGNIVSKAPNDSTRWQNIPWSNVARWEPFYTQAGTEEGIAPLMLVAFSLVESNAQHYTDGGMTFKGSFNPARGLYGNIVVRGSDTFDDVPAVGMMQVKLGYHAAAYPEADGYTPLGNLRLAARLLKKWIAETGSWEEALKQKYHPGNDRQSGVTQAEYIRSIRDIIAEVKRFWGETTPTPTPEPTGKNPFPKPVIYTLTRDYARFGLTKYEADRILDNFFDNRNGGKPRFIVNHIQDGITTGSLDWWANGAGVQASSTVMANKDGSILQIIPEMHGPWTNGDVCSPTEKSKVLRLLGGNPNNWSLTLEAEGNPGITAVSYTPAELQAVLWQYADWMITYDMPLSAVLSHASINFCDRENCPGEANQLAVLDGLAKAKFK